MSGSRARLILELAVERGLVESLPGAALDDSEGMLEHLLASGELSPEVVDELGREVDSGDDAATVVETPESSPRPRTPHTAPAAKLPPEDATLADWGRFRLTRLLGEGGMGRVYEAWDPRLERNVALKFIRSDDPVLAQRFEREAKLQARLEHEHVCQVYEVGEVRGRLYIAMQLLRGSSLATAQRRMELRDKVEVIRLVALALYEAHTNGLIHRDIKPSNIVVRRKDDGSWHPWILDFGLARDAVSSDLTVGGMLLGTPRYMSPEQARDQDLDHRTDIFSLGASLYEMVSGTPPFGRVSSVAALVNLLHTDPPLLRRRAPDVPKDLEAIVMRCLEREPERRYANALDLADDLRRFLDGEPVAARPPSRLRMAWRWVRRRPWRSAAVLAALLALGLWQLTVWQAGRDAELVHRVTRQVDELEGQLRTAILAPVHDLTPELERARRRLGEIEDELHGARRRAAGPGHLALARGYLTVDDLERALDHAQRARAVGFRDPEASFTHGRILVALYQRELRAAERLPVPAEAEARIDQARRQYRDRALQLLEEGRAAPGAATELAEALVAQIDGQYELALERAEAAASGSRWPHQVWELEGRLYLERATHLGHAGEYEQASTDIDRAFDRFDRVLDVARSSPQGHLGRCLAWYSRVQLAMDLGGDLEEPVTRALETCDTARTVRPDNPEPMEVASGTCWTMARHLLQQGRDPAPWLERASDRARDAMAADPNRVEGRLKLGYVHLTRATMAVRQGNDPSTELDEALAAFAAVLQKDPGELSALNASGVALRYQARWLSVQGQDPRPRLEQAVDAYQRALAADPELLPALVNLGSVWVDLGLAGEARGASSQEAYRQAVGVLERAVELNPNHPMAWANLCGASLMLSDALQAAGEDVAGMLARAIAACERGVELDPGNPVARHNLGALSKTRAVYERASGGDAAASLEAARSALEAALELNPTEARTALILVEVALDRADLALADGDDPGALVAEATRWLERAQELAADPGDLVLFGAEIDLVGLRQEALADRDPTGEVRRVTRSLAGLTGADQGKVATVAGEAQLIAAWWALRSGEDATEALRAADDVLGRLSTDGESELLRGWRGCLGGEPSACARIPGLLAEYPSAGFRFGYLKRLPGGPAPADR